MKNVLGSSNSVNLIYLPDNFCWNNTSQKCTNLPENHKLGRSDVMQSSPNSNNNCLHMIQEDVIFDAEELDWIGVEMIIEENL